MIFNFMIFYDNLNILTYKKLSKIVRKLIKVMITIRLKLSKKT